MLDNLFKEIHGNNNENLIPVSRFNGRYELTLGLKSYKKEIKILKEKVPHLIDHIYFIPNSFMQTFYFYKGNVWMDVYQLDWKSWEMFDQQERIETLIEFMDEKEKEKDYETIFSYMDKKILITKYIELFDSIPAKQKYICFRDLWSRSEYGFDQFTPSFLEKVFKYKEFSEERNASMNRLKEEIGEHETITVYRGVTSSSTHYEKAISWTLNEDVAEFFAMRFNSKGKIMKAEIHIDDIHDYLSNRNEEEILLNPKKLINTEVHYYI